MIRRKKSHIAIVMALGMLLTTTMPAGNVYASEKFDYKLALKDSVIFYDANKCGKDVAINNEFDFRSACHTSDGSGAGVDLTGGYHDAGDHVKFGLPQGYAASVMGWALYEFKDGFDKAGNTEKQLEQFKYFTDYFLKCHTAKDVFYYQVGSGGVDHAYWGSPEKQTRDSYLKRADSGSAASDILGETTAALSLMYLNYKDKDSTYANKCLYAAKELYSMGKTNRGCGDSQGFYNSSAYNDDLAWGGIWLYRATNDTQYLNEAEQFLVMDNPYFETTWTMCWNDMKVPVAIELWKITKNDKYKKAVDFNMNYWKNNIKTSPGGLKCLNDYGSLRYAAAASMLALVINKESKDESLVNLAESQINYILGDNPATMSYMVGFGDKYPKHPHHRAANGYTNGNHDNEKEAKYVLTGALVGGPDGNDNYIDDVNRYDFTEVALDYNAGLVGALAGIVDIKYSKLDTVLTGDVNGDGVVSSIDYIYLKKYLSGSKITINESNSDLNKDGKINVLDLIALKEII